MGKQHEPVVAFSMILQLFFLLWEILLPLFIDHLGVKLKPL